MTEEARITLLLQQANEGDQDSMDQAVEIIYSDLRRLAAFHIGKHHGSRNAALTLQPTALVNETYIKLLRQKVGYTDREHFLAIATRLMLRVLIDHQRSKSAAKRGGDQIRVTLTGLPSHHSEADAAACNILDALEKLETLDRRKADVIRLRAVWGMEMREVAESLGVSLATVERDWRFAKNWLAEELDV